MTQARAAEPETAATEERRFPLDMLRRHLAEHLARVPDRDDRERLQRRVKTGPDYPVRWDATELTPDQCVQFAKQILMSVGGRCEHLEPANGRNYGCGSCTGCEAHAERKRQAVDLIARAFDAAESDVLGTASEIASEPDNPKGMTVWCQNCGRRFTAKHISARTCSGRCRKAMERARHKAGMSSRQIPGSP
jgi:hypothetical protein